MQSEVSPIYGKRAAAKLKKLRREDPQRNLVERWKRVLEKRPDAAMKYGFLPMVIDAPGWAVVAVPDDAVSYTVGLHYRFGQKEILISAPHLKLEQQKRLLNSLGRRVIDGERFAAGDTVTFDDGKTNVKLASYEDATFDRFPCGYFARFEELFEDRLHTAGGTLPILWGVIAPRKAKKVARS